MNKLNNIGGIGNNIEKIIRGEVTLWFWQYREEEMLLLQDISTTFLNRKEQLRLKKMVSVGRRADYLAGRWLVKKVKGDGDYSLSHSEGVIVLAMANGVRDVMRDYSYLGIDIECQSRKEHRKYNKENRDKLVARFFSEEEQMVYLKKKEEEYKYFLKIWTQKEACYKYLSNRENRSSDYQKVSFFKLMRKEIASLFKEEKLEVDTFFFKKYASMVSIVSDKVKET